MADSWPMLEKIAVRALNDNLARGRAGTKLPAKVEELDGFVRVARGPGSDDGITDSPLLDVEAFHKDQTVAWEIAEDARQIVLALAASNAAGHLIDAVNTATSPNYVYYGPHAERYVASYRVSYRR